MTQELIKTHNLIFWVYAELGVMTDRFLWCIIKNDMYAIVEDICKIFVQLSFIDRWNKYLITVCTSTVPYCQVHMHDLCRGHGLLCNGPFHWRFFHHNLNSGKYWYLFCFPPISNIVINTKFYTWHDNCVVVTCAKFGTDLMAQNLDTVKQILYRIIWGKMFYEVNPW